tara:strand:+ start:447 stop:1169 length:723 start_codon:yes stop_codon:yes gene_type:complete
MKKFASFFINLVLFIALIVAFHYLYQLLWAWERLWQGLVLFSLLSLPFAQSEVLQLFLDNKIPLNGKLYKDQNRSFKIMWFLSYISALIGVFFLLAIFSADQESSDGSVIGTWVEWLILITIYGLFLIPMFRCGNKIEKAKQDIELKKEEEKAKKKKASAEKRKLKKKLEKEKLEKELEIKKIELKEFLEFHKLESMKQIEELNKKKEKLEASISKEKETITELNNKYPFIGKIVPNRIK